MSRLHRENHNVSRIGWLRAAVLGANDGIGMGVAVGDGVLRGTFGTGVGKARPLPSKLCVSRQTALTEGTDFHCPFVLSMIDHVGAVCSGDFLC